MPPRVIWAHGVKWWPVALRAGDFKLIVQGPDDAGELFNVAQDPLESHDVSAVHPDIAAAMRAMALWESAQRRRFDPSMDMDRCKLMPRMPTQPPPLEADAIDR